MKFERLALWAERELFTEQGEKSKGFLGWLKGCFSEESLVLSDMLSAEDPEGKIHRELELLTVFLTGESAEYMLRTLSELNAFCRDRVHDHIPYSFHRECWGFRVLTEDRAWYIALTPWNSARHVSIYVYDRKILMTFLAAQKGLPESCWGVLPYTGERIFIRYGADLYENFPQYGGSMVENHAYAHNRNEVAELSVQQVAAMENGVIFGWDTPMAVPSHYDENGHFYIPIAMARERRR